ncbi:MAG: hypothetical protein Q8R60_01335 [Mycobacteriales bacterium]|nr:hypothetical protein [Mycobacteriales bacterium]
MTAALRRAGAPLVYLLLACLGHLGAFRGLSSQTHCRCEDAPQTDWFLAWTPWAISQGRSPLFTDHLVAPEGVNLMWNTLLPLPGLLLWPVTAAFGPVAAHNLLSVLAFALSATAMWWAVWRWAPWWPARFAAGLLYGFSPYLVAQGRGHLNLSLVLLPPLVLVVLDELLVRRRRRPLVLGVLLGVVTAAQLLITEEVLASTFVMCVAGLVVLVVQQRRRVGWAHVERALTGLVVAAAVLFQLTVWPLAEQFGGERVVTEPVQDTSYAAADLLGTVVPTVNQALGTDATITWGGNVSENGSYLGAPLLLLVVVIAVALRRRPEVRFFGCLGLVAWVLSLGESLHVAGTSYDVTLPFRAVTALPVLHNLAAVRFSLHVVLCVAVLLAVGIDRARPALTGDRVPAGRRVLVGAVAVAVVAPLVPAWPYSFEPTRTPSYFSSSAVERVPEGAVAVTYPVPRFPGTAPMLWQAEAGFRFRMVGGYAITPLGDGHGTFVGGRTRVEDAFAAAANGRSLPTFVSGPLRELISMEMERAGVTTFLVAVDEPGADEARAWLERLLVRGPDEVVGGVAAWYDVRWPEPVPPTRPLRPRGLR